MSIKDGQNADRMTQYCEGVEPGSVPGGGAVPGVLLQDSVPGRSGWKHGAQFI